VSSVRYTIAMPDGTVVNRFAISPNGRYTVVAATLKGTPQLWLRPSDSLLAQPMATTEGATYPFWSPDSRYIGFFTPGKLKKIAVSGGPAQSLCETFVGLGGSWGRDDVILFSPSLAWNGLLRVSAAGGVPSPLAKNNIPKIFPVFLPDGRHFLYLAVGSSPEKNGIYFGSLDGAEGRRVLPDISAVSFAPSPSSKHLGWILFVRENSLMALP